jgi:hypothetical protein
MSIFALVTLAAWGLWVAPHARKALAATLAAAAVAYLPWAGGLRGDLRSPDSGAIDLFAPFSADVVRTSLGRWFIGDPGLAADLSGVPGRLALVAVVAGVVLGVAGALAYRRSAARPRSTARTVLVVAMALATPVGLALGSVVGSDMFVTRSLAASTPWLLLAVGALLTSAGRLRIPATVLVVAAFAMGATRAVEQRFARPDFDAAAGYVDASAGREDTVVDSAVFFLTPGPLSGLDAALERPHRLIRNGAPQQREHNFRPDEPVLPTDEVLRRAVAPGGRVFVVVVDPPRTPETVADAARTWDRLAAALPRPYRREKLVTFESAFDLGVLVYVPAPAGGR